MDIQALKIELVQKILSSQNISLLSQVNELFSSETDQDWWDQLPSEIQNAILEGAEQVEKGRSYSHEQVLAEAKQKYGF